MESGPQAGWYPDPAGGSLWRWWNGVSWSDTTTPNPGGEVAEPATTGEPAAVAQPVAATQPLAVAEPAGAVQPVAPAAPPAPVGASSPHNPASPYNPAAYNPAGYGTAPPQQMRRGRNSGPNRFAYTTLVVVAIYLALAFSTGVVFLGIFPALSAYRSWRMREPLAPVAIVVAAISVVVGFTTLAHR